jgi:hypothetical protein
MASKKTSKKTAKKTSKKPTLPFVLARCTNAGVHAGYLVSEKGGRVKLKDARRIWYWAGAASLSEIAVYGCNPSKLSECRFAAKVDVDLLTADVCELIFCAPAGQKMIEAQVEWRA